MAGRLSSVDRGRIVSLHEEGYSKASIAERLRVSWRTVARWIGRYEEEGHTNNHLAPGASRKTTAQEDRDIIDFARATPLTNAVHIKEVLGLNVSAGTVRNRLRGAGLRHRIPASKQRLTPAQRLARLQFARNYRDLDWRDVVFIDEKTFSSTGQVSNCHVRLDPVQYNYTTSPISVQ